MTESTIMRIITGADERGMRGTQDKELQAEEKDREVE
jgi:hypothetical protein